jgi:hypothetical protein
VRPLVQALRRIFGPMRGEVTGGWGKHTILFAKYNLNDQAKEDESGRACSTNESEEEYI